MPTGRGKGGVAPAAIEDSPVVAALRRSGAVILGKTRTSEDGWSASTVGWSGAATANPWRTDRSAGGSSGGAACAVATGLGCLGVGTDGAGSVRIPAAWCGLVGFKPTWERWPYGHRGDRLSHVGLLATEVQDIIYVDDIIARPVDGPTAWQGDRPPRLTWLELPRASHSGAAIRATLEKLMDEPVLNTRLDTEGAHEALVSFLAAAEYPRLADEGSLWPAHAEVALLGADMTEDELRHAGQRCRALADRLDEALEGRDALVLPTVAVPAFGRNEEFPPGTETRNWLAWAENTFLTNLTGHPAISLPWGIGPDGVPVGLQLIGARGEDQLLLSVACAVQAALGEWTRRRAN
jgi:aspartyl-tRNA(Asn)/glutamyl-tRNA(Gln) amidotransferase subunit A